MRRLARQVRRPVRHHHAHPRRGRLQLRRRRGRSGSRPASRERGPRLPLPVGHPRHLQHRRGRLLLQHQRRPHRGGLGLRAHPAPGRARDPPDPAGRAGRLLAVDGRRPRQPPVRRSRDLGGGGHGGRSDQVPGAADRARRRRHLAGQDDHLRRRDHRNRWHHGPRLQRRLHARGGEPVHGGGHLERLRLPLHLVRGQRPGQARRVGHDVGADGPRGLHGPRHPGATQVHRRLRSAVPALRHRSVRRPLPAQRLGRQRQGRRPALRLRPARPRRHAARVDLFSDHRRLLPGARGPLRGHRHRPLGQGHHRRRRRHPQTAGRLAGLWRRQARPDHGGRLLIGHPDRHPCRGQRPEALPDLGDIQQRIGHRLHRHPDRAGRRRRGPLPALGQLRGVRPVGRGVHPRRRPLQRRAPDRRRGVDHRSRRGQQPHQRGPVGRGVAEPSRRDDRRRDEQALQQPRRRGRDHRRLRRHPHRPDRSRRSERQHHHHHDGTRLDELRGAEALRRSHHRHPGGRNRANRRRRRRRLLRAGARHRPQVGGCRLRAGRDRLRKGKHASHVVERGRPLRRGHRRRRQGERRRAAGALLRALARRLRRGAARSDGRLARHVDDVQVGHPALHRRRVRRCRQRSGRPVLEPRRRQPPGLLVRSARRHHRGRPELARPDGRRQGDAQLRRHLRGWQLHRRDEDPAGQPARGGRDGQGSDRVPGGQRG